MQGDNFILCKGSLEAFMKPRGKTRGLGPTVIPPCLEKLAWPMLRVFPTDFPPTLIRLFSVVWGFYGT